MNGAYFVVTDLAFIGKDFVTETSCMFGDVIATVVC